MRLWTSGRLRGRSFQRSLRACACAGGVALLREVPPAVEVGCELILHGKARDHDRARSLVPEPSVRVKHARGDCCMQPSLGVPFRLSARRLLRRDLGRVCPSGCRPGACCAGPTVGCALRAVGPAPAGAGTSAELDGRSLVTETAAVEGDAPGVASGGAGDDHQRQQVLLPRVTCARARGLYPALEAAVTLRDIEGAPSRRATRRTRRPRRAPRSCATGRRACCGTTCRCPR